MGYTALLFCPDEKTARTVTQVLGDLEFSVEACIEPFAAVKKLMGQHFDAIVVDCDNEQNATLLFKSARNSASNQTSLAVAVVEGQAGVAKAFRIGANLVLTKPINIEQAKGTLRVARGLLRKGEPAKGAAATAVSPAPSKPIATKPVIEPKSEPRPEPQKEAPVPAPVFSAPAPEIPAVRPVPAWPAAAATANATPSAQDDDLLDIDAAAPTSSTSRDLPAAESRIAAASVREPETKPASAGFSIFGSGAASAPAPARIPQSQPSEAAKSLADDAILEDPTTAAAEPSSVVGSTPSFTFGGATTETEPSGGSKKILIGVAAAIIAAVGIYAGWIHFQGTSEQPASSETPVTSAPAAISQPVKPSTVPPSSLKAPGVSAQDSQSNKPPSPEKLQEEIDAAAGSHKSSGVPSEKAGKGDADEITEPAPLVVKGGKTPTSKTKTADAPAPSLIGMAAPGASVPPPNLVTSTEPAFKPTLQTLNISQGVSQGLLIKKVPPSYPPNALRMHIEGAVELMATITKSGVIAQIKVLSGDPQLTKAATDAVKQWKYKPYLLNGEPVEIQTQITVNFKLPH